MKICEDGISKNVECNDASNNDTCTTIACKSTDSHFASFVENAEKFFESDPVMKILTDGRAKFPTEYINETCEPKKSFMNYCNYCMCGSNGKHAICSTVDCHPGIFDKNGLLKLINDTFNNRISNDNRNDQPTCEPNSVFPYYCNICGCQKNGISRFCTQMLCPVGVFGRNGIVNPSQTYLRPTETLMKLHDYLIRNLPLRADDSWIDTP